MVNVYIKNMDDEAYKTAKKMAIDRDQTMGELFSEAVESMKKKHGKKTRKKNPVVATWGVLGPVSDKEFKEELKRFKKIREEIGESLEERIQKKARY